MDSVSTANQVMVILRQALSERDRTTRGVGSSDNKRTNALGTRTRANPGASNADLRSRIAVLKGDGVSDGHALIRFMVEGLLVAEFGQAMRNDPEFQRMVTEVHQGLIEIDSVHALFESMV